MLHGRSSGTVYFPSLCVIALDLNANIGDGLSTLATLAPPHDSSIRVLLAQCARDSASSLASSSSPTVAAAWSACIQHSSDAMDRWPELMISPASTASAAVRAQYINSLLWGHRSSDARQHALQWVKDLEMCASSNLLITANLLLADACFSLGDVAAAESAADAALAAAGAVGMRLPHQSSAVTSREEWGSRSEGTVTLSCCLLNRGVLWCSRSLWQQAEVAFTTSLSLGFHKTQAMYNLTILRLKTRRSNEAASGWLRHRNISTALSGSEYAAMAVRLHALAQDQAPAPPTRTLVLGTLNSSLLLRLDVAMIMEWKSFVGHQQQHRST